MTSRMVLVILAVAVLAVLAARASGLEEDAGAAFAATPACEPCPACAPPAAPSFVPQGGNFELVVCILWLAVAAALKRASWARSNSPEELIANLVARVPLLGQLLALWRTPPPPPSPPAAKS